MDETFSDSLTLLAVGMITVFMVLALVAMTGNLLIYIVNTLHKDSNKGSRTFTKQNDEEKIAVLAAVVENVTGGRGRISDITKK